MSSKSVDKNALKIQDHEDIIEEFFNLKNLIISFSEIFGYKKEDYIYSGDEKISFEKRHPLYQIILRKEFGESIRDYI